MISYEPLFVTLLQHGMKKTDLKQAIGLSGSTIAKLSKNQYISLEIIDRLCQYLQCNVEDIIKIIPD